LVRVWVVEGAFLKLLPDVVTVPVIRKSFRTKGVEINNHSPRVAPVATSQESD